MGQLMKCTQSLNRKLNMTQNGLNHFLQLAEVKEYKLTSA